MWIALCFTVYDDIYIQFFFGNAAATVMPAFLGISYTNCYIVLSVFQCVNGFLVDFPSHISETAYQLGFRSRIQRNHQIIFAKLQKIERSSKVFFDLQPNPFFRTFPCWQIKNLSLHFCKIINFLTQLPRIIFSAVESNS